MFDEITIPSPDVKARMVERTLLQFRESPVFLDVLTAFGAEVQRLLDAIVGVVKERCPAEARGAQLDGIGRIVGQLRTIMGFDAIAWFAPDRNFQGPDQAPVWVTNAPLSGDVAADDSFFRQLIEAKVTRNFVRFGSVPELQDFCRQAFNIDVSFVRVDIMTVQVIISDSAGFNVLSLLEKYEDTSQAEHVHFLPLAAGVQIASVITLSEYLDSSSS